jgi:outer membrane receptor for ferrienterochelin and colicin
LACALLGTASVSLLAAEPPGRILSIDGTAFDNNSSQPLLQNQEEGAYDAVVAHIGSYSYLDLAMLWQISPHLQWRFGVTNVFDRWLRHSELSKLMRVGVLRQYHDKWITA